MGLFRPCGGIHTGQLWVLEYVIITLKPTICVILFLFFYCCHCPSYSPSNMWWSKINEFFEKHQITTKSGIVYIFARLIMWKLMDI